MNFFRHGFRYIAVRKKVLKGVSMNLPYILQRFLGIEPKTDNSDIRSFQPEEFRAFCLAGKEHQVSASRIHEDFRGYLKEFRVPAYVSETVGHLRSSRRRKR